MSSQEDFLKYQAQTTPFPIGVEVERAEGSYIYDTSGKAYLDMVSGIAVTNIGHRHPKVIKAIKNRYRPKPRRKPSIENIFILV